jgi:hypothetical protein
VRLKLQNKSASFLFAGIKPQAICIEVLVMDVLCVLSALLLLIGFLVSMGVWYQLTFLFECDESARPHDFRYKSLAEAYMDLGFLPKIVSRKWESASDMKFVEALKRARFCLIYGTSLMAGSFFYLWFFCAIDR